MAGIQAAAWGEKKGLATAALRRRVAWVATDVGMERIDFSHHSPTLVGGLVLGGKKRTGSAYGNEYKLEVHAS